MNPSKLYLKKEIKFPKASEKQAQKAMDRFVKQQLELTVKLSKKGEK